MLDPDSQAELDYCRDELVARDVKIGGLYGELSSMKQRLDRSTNNASRWEALHIRAASANSLLCEEYRTLRDVLERIAFMGMDCPAAQEPADFYRCGLMAAISTAARAIKLGAA